MSKAIIAAPAQKAINATRADLESATLSTIAAACGAAGANLSALSGAAKALSGSVTKAVLRVIAKERIGDVVGPLREAIGNAGKGVSNLSTIRTAVLKMRVAYAEGKAEDGAGPALPVWETVAEAKESGDAAVTAAVSACIVYAGKTDAGVPVDPRVDTATRDALMARINDACAEFGLSEDSAGKVRGVYFTALQNIVADAEQASETAAADAEQAQQQAEDAAIVADAHAQLLAEVETLRQIAAEAKRIFGIETESELLAEMAITDAA
jgi:hypothetical protein